MNDVKRSIEYQVFTEIVGRFGCTFEDRLRMVQGFIEGTAEALDTGWTGEIVQTMADASPAAIAAQHANCPAFRDSLHGLKSSAETLTAVLARILQTFETPAPKENPGED